jgi:NAD(P)-dependent dehydrogenase (short-subunit alcohol dehydrogenase family)
MNNKEKDFLRDKTVVITGATKGLGKALSLKFAESGYHVVGVYRSDSGSAASLEAEFEANGHQGIFIRQDITEEGNWTEFDEIIKAKRESHFTFIANACAPFTPKPFHLIDWLEVSSQIDVNVKGAFLTFKRLLPYMVKAGAGNVISVLTSAVDSPPKGFAAYVTTKSALEGLTRAWAAEYAARGLRFFSVCPGFMETALTAAWSDHLKATLYSNKEAVQQPADVAASILALLENVKTRGAGENYLI